MKTSSKSFAITGTCYWAKVQKPDPDTGKYSIDVTLDDAAKDLLKSLGITWRNKGDEKGDFFSPWKHSTDRDGNEKPLRVLDADMNTFTGLIGNGSKVAVEFYPREWKYGTKAGIRPSLLTVQVLELVTYNASPLKPVSQMQQNDKTAKAFEPKVKSSGSAKEVV